MKNSAVVRLSFWASRNRPLAIAFLVICKIYIGATGLLLGAWAALEGFVLPVETKWGLAAVTLFAFQAYPARHLKSRLGRAGYYRRQKKVDFLLATLGFLILFFAGNLTPGWLSQPEYARAEPTAIVSKPASLKSSGSIESKGRVADRENKWMKRGVAGKFKKWAASKLKKRAERALKKIADLSDAAGIVAKVLLSIMLLLIAFLVAYLVTALACQLLCAGEAGVAMVLVLAGAIGIVAGLIFGFKFIWTHHQTGKADIRHKQKRPPTSVGD